MSPADNDLMMRPLPQLGLESVNVLEPGALSAGQARRLAVARTLARAEAIYRAGGEQTVLTVLVDEPTAHLDAYRPTWSRALRLAGLAPPVLIVTHEGELAAHCDHLVRAELAARLPSTRQRRPALRFRASPAHLLELKSEHEKPKAAPSWRPPRRGREPARGKARRPARHPAHPQGAGLNRCAPSPALSPIGGDPPPDGRGADRAVRLAHRARARVPP